MRILLSGGGTGGHITPILAVARELKQLKPDCYVIYVGERGGKFAALTRENSDIDEIRTIFAGKFRRYHSEAWWQRLLDIKTLFLNIRDSIYFIIGFLQSLILLPRLKPDVILLKGGFVGVPVGLSAAFWHRPFITHDSDIVPGLANRIVAKWARWHATGMPAAFYDYPSDSVKHVGVLVSEAFVPVNSELQRQYKRELDIPANSPLLLITGGSLGAIRLNKAAASIIPSLLSNYPHLHVVHQVGKGRGDTYRGYQSDRLHVLEFMHGMHRYTGAADVVVTRAGANTLAELGVQGKTAVVVPNPLLTAGHQLKNAVYLEKQHAVLTVPETGFETDSASLDSAIRSLLDSETKRQNLARALQTITIVDAAHHMAMLLLETAKHHVQKKETTIQSP